MPTIVPTWSEFSAKFLDDYCRAERQKPSGIAAKQTVLRLHILPRWGLRRLDDLTNQDVQRLKRDLAGKSAKTVNNVLAVASKILKIAIEWDVIDRMPCKFRMVKAPVPSMSFYGFEEYDRLIAEAGKHRQELLAVLLGGDAGLRCGEMRGLRWRDVSFTTRTLCVERSIWEAEITPTKGWRLRHIPLTSRLFAALGEHEHRNSEWVLCRMDGGFLSKKQLQKAVRRAACRCDLPAGLHLLRHTFCSHLAMRGAPLAVIRELAGHSDFSTTMRYIHLSVGAKENAIRLLEQGG